jgi:hypothetical protein
VKLRSNKYFTREFDSFKGKITVLAKIEKDVGIYYGASNGM